MENLNITSVLLVDANTDFTCRVSGQLEQWGYTTQTAHDLEQLRASLASCDILLCGEFQPGDSLKLLQSIRKHYPNLPIILLASEIDQSLLLQSLRLWVSDCLLKTDIDPDMLMQALQRCQSLVKKLKQARHYQEEMLQANQDLQGSLDALRRDQQAGRFVQNKMLPETPMAMAGMVMEHKVVPSCYLSGDFIDYLALDDDKLVFCVADVAGHGASSAFITVLLKHALATQRSQYFHKNQTTILEPRLLLGVLNKEIMALGLGRHVTLIVGCIDQEQHVLKYCLAGHLPPPILSVPGESRYLTGEGPPIGLFPDPEFVQHQLDLPERWSISCFSDGVFDLLDAQSLTACEQELLQRCHNRVQSLDLLLDELALPEGDAPDDISILNIRMVE